MVRYEGDVNNFQGKYDAKHPTQKMSTTRNFFAHIGIGFIFNDKPLFCNYISQLYDTILKQPP